jgi:hypothetical protein
VRLLLIGLVAGVGVGFFLGLALAWWYDDCHPHRPGIAHDEGWVQRDPRPDQLREVGE